MNPSGLKYIIGIVIGSSLILASPLIAFIGYAFNLNRTLERTASGELELSADALKRNLDSASYFLAIWPIGFICGVGILSLSIVYLIRTKRLALTAALKSEET